MIELHVVASYLLLFVQFEPQQYNRTSSEQYYVGVTLRSTSELQVRAGALPENTKATTDWGTVLSWKC